MSYADLQEVPIGDGTLVVFYNIDGWLECAGNSSIFTLIDLIVESLRHLVA
jgi:hypothetical protein